MTLPSSLIGKTTPGIRLAHDYFDPAMLYDADDLDHEIIVEVWITPHQNRKRAEELAARIVQAVNEFPKLQAALRELVELLLDEHLLNRLDDALNAHPPLDPVRLVSLLRARDAARAALGEVK